MIVNRTWLTLIFLALINQGPALAGSAGTQADDKPCETDQWLSQIGHILNSQEIDDPQHALEIIVQYGTDTRYYLMIRGWLKEHLQALESQYASVTDADKKTLLGIKRDFINNALRRIDLE